ncbi:Fur family transcriptional regulator [Thermoanaerobacter wiegelii]|uniref:Ferric uptake regulator, Fur family n=1 Tax=Thermoanaerobacter wiegelii Rt8.B1 TaxID=697303 RepID=G2MWV3_9THEO|nr:Fur family transcriptional regulator [Thermoanaerobacter wiegelii]AEM79215.1 ferric uptake regulator, Fur family [Thermoanaerobacter wiegelii Rt8.B1]
MNDIKSKNDLMSLLIKALKANGLKITEKRQILLNVFLKNPDTHFDFDTLYQEAKKEWSHYGVATLYRNLKIFVDKGILSENIIGTKKYYELKMFNKKKIHAHLICKYCGNIDEYYSPDLIKYIKMIDKKYDFDVYYGELNFYGICSKCKKTPKNEKH